MGYAMEAVPPNLVAEIEVIRNRVQKRSLRQRVMECRIKYGDLRNLRSQQFAHGANSPKIRWVMQGCEVDAVLDSCHHCVGDQNRIRKSLATVYDSTAYRVDVRYALNF